MEKSVCIETMFLELTFEDRFAQARKCGFEYVEFWTWTDKDIYRIKELCNANDLKIASFSGDQKFSMICEDESTEYIEFAMQSIKTASFLNCGHLVLHSNALGENGRVMNSYDHIPRNKKISTMVKTLKILGPLADSRGVKLVIEPLNSFVDHCGNFLVNTADAADIIKQTGCVNVKVLYDIYHMQIMEGNIINTIKKYFGQIGYIHVADVPRRHEPGTGEINYANVFKVLRELNYEGIVGYELFPAKTSEETSGILINI